MNSLVRKMIAQAIEKGPETVDHLLDTVNKLPSDSTLLRFTEAAEKLIPYLPTLEKAIGNGDLSKLERLAQQMPDQATLSKLLNLLPLLEKIPDKTILSRLLDKADSLGSFLESLEEGS